MIAHEKGNNGETPARKLLVILTLQKHIDGIWITRLSERLKESVPTCSSFRHTEIEIRTLENWMAEGWLVSEEGKCSNNHGIIGIVNRVSDAASPALFKACCALLAAAEDFLKIPVWNGSTAYSLCGNKWRHHLIFLRAKLHAPKTMAYYVGYNGVGEKQQKAQQKTLTIDTQMFRRNEKGNIKILVKPNAGGFGAGIKKISLPSSFPRIDEPNQLTKKRTAEISIPSSFEDDMALVQQYEIPSDGNIYRVWFLNGKIQCAVKRAVDNRDQNEEDGSIVISSAAEFTSGCAGGNLCNLSGPPTISTTPRSLASTRATPSNIIPWEVSEDVREEIEHQLLPLLPDAHCGSVEFLCSATTSKSTTTPGTESTMPTCCSGDKENSGKLQRRLYFDLNLLSTLPITENMDIQRNGEEGEIVWPEDFDPWLELAHGIWEFIQKKT